MAICQDTDSWHSFEHTSVATVRGLSNYGYGQRTRIGVFGYLRGLTLALFSSKCIDYESHAPRGWDLYLYLSWFFQVVSHWAP